MSDASPATSDVSPPATNADDMSMEYRALQNQFWDVEIDFEIDMS